MASIKDLKRMCKEHHYCIGCPLAHLEGCMLYRLPINIDEIVNKWVDESPTKTYAMDFFEKFPNAPRDSDGAPKTCWKHVYGDGKYCSSDACTECWNREMKEGAKNE